MDLSLVGIAILIVSALVSFALGRWWSRGRRNEKRQRERIERESRESRQVRRAREREQRR